MNVLLSLLLFTAQMILQTSVVSAQVVISEYPETVRITSPAEGAVIEETFVIDGFAHPETGLAVRIDGIDYVDPKDRGKSVQRGAALIGTSNPDGSFTIRIDLSGLPLLEKGQELAVLPGTHVVEIFELYRPESGKSPGLSLRLMPRQDPSYAVPSATPEPLVSDQESVKDHRAATTAALLAVCAIATGYLLIRMLLNGRGGRGRRR